MQNINKIFDDNINPAHFYMYNEVAKNNNVFTFPQMLTLVESKGFVITMIKAIEDHQSRGHLDLC